MVKERKYTIKNKQYFYALSAFFSELNAQQIAGCLVGGTAVQVRVAKAKSNSNDIAIDSLNLDGLLRETDDIDVCLLDSARSLDLNKLEREEERGEEVYQLILKRNGVKKPILEVHSLDDCCEIKLNISYCKDDANALKDYYAEMILSAEPLVLKNNGIAASISVARPEYIIASKLVRHNERDVQDIKKLCQLEKGIDFDKIKRMLKKEGLDLHELFCCLAA